MSAISLRAVHISNGTLGLTVMFSWIDKSKPMGHTYQCKVVEETNDVTIEALRDNLNKLGVRWFIGDMKQNRFSIVGDIPQALNGLFDLAISDPDPVIALTTPYEFIIQPHKEPTHDA